MAFTYDPNTDRGKVRLLITDNNSESPIFNDTEIDTFLELSAYDGENDILIAAAYALETIATNEALVQKVIKTLDLSTDGTRVADAIMKRARELRNQADQYAGFEIAEMNVNKASALEIIIKDYIEKN